MSIPAVASTRRFGHLEMCALLGKSDATTTWLAVDPRSRREVLLCLPRRPPLDDEELLTWRRSVAKASRLQHPGVARVDAAGVQDRWPWMQVDRSAGETLAERLHRDPRALPPMQVVEWMCQLLEALAAAHEAGIAHRDVQLHTVVVDAGGRARLLGLEVALWTSDAAPTMPDPMRGIAMAVDPAQLRHQREAATRDLLMCGLLMHRLLAGVPPLDEPDAGRAADRLPPVGREFVRLPWTMPYPIPEVLRAIANRATDRQVARRYLTARSMLRALENWRQCAASDDGGALALMLERLAAVGPLPAHPELRARLTHRSLPEERHARDIAGDLLVDIGLSFELLRQVNAAGARRPRLEAGDPVLTLRRAVALLGLRGVQRAAQGLRPWPGPLGPGPARALAVAMDQARVAAGISVRLRPAGYDAEVVYLLALLQNLGRLLVHYHFPDEAGQIRQLTQTAPGTGGLPPTEGLSEREASYAVLGIDSEAIGGAVARHWGLPDDVLMMIRRIPQDRPVRGGSSDAELLRATAAVGNEAADALRLGERTQVVQALQRVVRRYGRLLSFSPSDLEEALRASQAAAREGRAVLDGETGGEPQPLGTHDPSRAPSTIVSELA